MLEDKKELLDFVNEKIKSFEEIKRRKIMFLGQVIRVEGML
jgi:hypothetical protein